MRISRVSVFATLLLATALSAQEAPPTSWGRVCKKATSEAIEIPPSLKSFVLSDVLARCDEMDLYYGFGHPPDYKGALRCGWYQRAHPQDKGGNMFYGPGVLTMLYANGFGVPQNLDLALRFACEQTWASDAEMAYRIEHIQNLKTASPTSKKFDLCQDATSGLSQGFCAAIDFKRRDAERSREIAAAVHSLPLKARDAFPTLQTASDAFIETRVRNEVDLSGTGRAAFELEEQTILRDQVLINVQRFAKDDVLPANETDLGQLDGELNAVYRRIMDRPDDDSLGTITREGIRKTERAWIKMADAWVDFSRMAYPGISSTRIRAELIRLRIDQLKSLQATRNE